MRLLRTTQRAVSCGLLCYIPTLANPRSPSSCFHSRGPCLPFSCRVYFYGPLSLFPFLRRRFRDRPGPPLSVGGRCAFVREVVRLPPCQVCATRYLLLRFPTHSPTFLESLSRSVQTYIHGLIFPWIASGRAHRDAPVFALLSHGTQNCSTHQHSRPVFATLTYTHARAPLFLGGCFAVALLDV